MNKKTGNTINKNPIIKTYISPIAIKIESVFEKIFPFIRKYRKEVLLIIITVVFTTVINYILINSNNKQQKQIVTVDILNIVRDFKINLLSSNLQEKQIGEEIIKFSIEIQKLMNGLAEDNNMIILSSQAVSGGVIDITQHVRQILNNDYGFLKKYPSVQVELEPENVKTEPFAEIISETKEGENEY
ncbi:TrbI F-type domain-containing protein [Pseudomonadota bacterium]